MRQLAAYEPDGAPAPMVAPTRGARNAAKKQYFPRAFGLLSRGTPSKAYPSPRPMMRNSTVLARKSRPVAPSVKPNCKFSTAAAAWPAARSTSQSLLGSKSMAATNNADGGQSTERPWLEITMAPPNLAARYETRKTTRPKRAVCTGEKRSVRDGGALLSPTKRWV